MPTYTCAFDAAACTDRHLLGGKGASLVAMTTMGLAVPPGFTLTTDAYHAYFDNGATLPDDVIAAITEAIAGLEARMGRILGGASDPLLVSVRSGSAISMPGMMDTVLNVGLTDAARDALAAESGNPAFAYQAQLRFVDMFDRIVLGGDRRDGPQGRTIETCRAEIERIREQGRERGAEIPADPVAQVLAAVGAVFRSWHSRRARDYRRVEGIPDDIGTAVTVQAMVFGNRDACSGTGVVFTRSPVNGEPQPYGDFLPGAQGEDVVAGRELPEPISALATVLPDCHTELVRCMSLLESYFHDMTELEFTIESGRLYLLQARVGKRTPPAAIRIAVDLANAGMITRTDAVRRVAVARVEDDQWLAPDTSDAGEAAGAPPAGAGCTVLVVGLAASPGLATGVVCLSAEDAEERADAGQQVILVRLETSPEDLHGMIASHGLLTVNGGLASHAAVIARAWGKPAVVGAREVVIDAKARRLRIGGVEVAEGEPISIDGATGEVFRGGRAGEVGEHSLSAAAQTLLGWADQFRSTAIVAQVVHAADARRALDYGADALAATEEVGAPIKVATAILHLGGDGAVAADGVLGWLRVGDAATTGRVVNGPVVTPEFRSDDNAEVGQPRYVLVDELEGIEQMQPCSGVIAHANLVPALRLYLASCELEREASSG